MHEIRRKRPPAGQRARDAVHDALTRDSEGDVDELRLFYLTHPGLDATEVLTPPTSSAVVSARRQTPR
ncbi:hypothetical protein GCM10010313_55020 [Streptomyces violarus]|nr:hypothetical protein GCM10010313_55020 [Streptomyces violarus]